MRQRKERKNPESRLHDMTLVISDFSGGGAQRVLTNLIRMWSEQGLRICLITFADESLDKYSLPIDITRLSLMRYGQSSATVGGYSRVRRTILQKIEANAPRIRVVARAVARAVYGVRDVHSLRKILRVADSPVVLAFLTATNVRTILGSTGLDVRVVVSERIDPEKQPPAWPWHVLRRWLYRYADAVTANSHGALESMASYVPKSKLFFVPNPVSFPSASVDNSRREKVILNVARLTRQKAQDVLLNAYARVVARAPEWKLLIVGEGRDKDELHALASSLGLSDRVAWIGWIPEIERYYERAGIFVLPSRFEGTPNALLEAMSFGLPSIIANGSPGPLEHIADGENGLVVPVDDEKRLAEAILRLISSRELRDRLGASARRTIEALNNDDIQVAWSTVLGLPEGGRNQRAASRPGSSRSLGR